MLKFDATFNHYLLSAVKHLRPITNTLGSTLITKVFNFYQTIMMSAKKIIS